MSLNERKSSPRHLARELVVQGLYQHLMTGDEIGKIRLQLEASDGFSKADVPFFRDYWRGVNAHQDQGVALITPHIDRSFNDVSLCERAILLMGAYELAECIAVPYRVVINECIELAKDFGGTDGHKYINGVLDKLAPALRTAEVQDFQNKRRR
ncbi:MAG: hypothetical protein RLZZ502_276 [Pseudomonadota bacterium]